MTWRILGDRLIIPEQLLWVDRGIWRMWAPLKVELLAGDLRVAMMKYPSVFCLRKLNPIGTMYDISYLHLT